ncbi:MAG: WhiB family transcriptional regulator [Actinomycetota bacterium]
MSWDEQAACRNITNPDLFFPDHTPTHPAFALCRRCPVKLECLEAGISNPHNQGIWGGWNIPSAIGSKIDRDRALKVRKAARKYLAEARA